VRIDRFETTPREELDMKTTTQPEWFAGSLLRWHVVSAETDGTFALGEAVVRPGGEPPLHVHAREDETFYVLDGEITFQRGHERIDAHPGDAVLMPRGVQHGFAVRTDTARLLQAFTPGGLEDAFRALSRPAPADALPPAPDGPPDPEVVSAMTSTFAHFGVEFTGPPLAVVLGAEGSPT
jgi:quercetin dioxygenase-like cupin family protein